MTAVDGTVTDSDRAALESLQSRCRIDESDPMNRIRAIQMCVLSNIPPGIIDHGQAREPGDVIAANRGECYDRARMIEKFLQIAGFETRHVALFARKPDGVFGLLRKGTPSHALVDVYTARGWMSVGTNVPFLGLTADGAVVASAGIARSHRSEWRYAAPSDVPSNDNFAIYGLWSRHGKFFPPYLPVPDIAWTELKYNLGQ